MENCGRSLTLEDLLSFKPKLNLPPTEAWTANWLYRNCWRQVQFHAVMLWKLWLTEYLSTIAHGQKRLQKRRNLVKILNNGSTPRRPWPLGRVVQRFHDNKGLARTIEVKTRNAELARPVGKLPVLIPADSGGKKIFTRFKTLCLNKQFNKNGSLLVLKFS